jgi:hypothetical protein
VLTGSIMSETLVGSVVSGTFGILQHVKLRMIVTAYFLDTVIGHWLPLQFILACCSSD